MNNIIDERNSSIDSKYINCYIKDNYTVVSSE